MKNKSIIFRKEPRKVIKTSRTNGRDYARKENRQCWNMRRSLAAYFHYKDKLTYFPSFSLFVLFKIKLGDPMTTIITVDDLSWGL